MLVNQEYTVVEDSAFNADVENEEEFLQELFAAGKLKPGLNVPIEKKTFTNNVDKLEEVLASIGKDLPWVERLDIVNEPAALAPELSFELKELEEFAKSGRSSSLSLNEFKRETLFHRQAQLVAIEGIARLKSQGLPTIRPNDYFAEMMKSDEHMQKVRRSLLEKQAGLQRSEKMKQLRKQKKLAKQKEVESVQRKHKEKRDLNEEIKKYRKGMRTDLDFLENKSGIKSKKEPDGKIKRWPKNNRKTGKVNNSKNSKFKKSAKTNNRPGKEKRRRMKNK